VEVCLLRACAGYRRRLTLTPASPQRNACAFRRQRHATTTPSPRHLPPAAKGRGESLRLHVAQPNLRRDVCQIRWFPYPSSKQGVEGVPSERGSRSRATRRKPPLPVACHQSHQLRQPALAAFTAVSRARLKPMLA
jgi:hypothetical protein